MRKGLKIVLALLALLAVLAAAVLIFFTVREYRPKPVEPVTAAGGIYSLKPEDTVTVMTYNTGYAALSETEDFFMDGGSGVQPESRELVEENLQGIARILEEHPADVYFLQEVDVDSKRSYGIDETDYYEKALGLEGMFACNFKCDFVPYPLPPIGKVESGIFTVTSYQTTEASRIALPESFSWPVKTCNLKRCMLETRIPVEGSGRELVLINFHLEAYDSGEGKIAQSKMLAEKLEEEYEKGNYVIAGGDFNQTFEGIDKYPIQNTEYWAPGTISAADLPAHFSFAVDDTYPTCRLLNAPYSGNYEDSQVYVIDGFIVSDNLTVKNCQVIDVGFRYTDHQPVLLEVSLDPA